MGTPHKHAEVIKAWADGATIQCRPTSLAAAAWETFCNGFVPRWDENMEYRVKPEPKSPGQLMYESWLGAGFLSWEDTSRSNKEVYELAANKFIDVLKQEGCL